MNVEDRLTEYIKLKYNPSAIILHGSRATGFSRCNSDWDFAIIVNHEIETFSEIIEEANIEVRALQLPLNDKIGERWLAIRRDNIKVLYDPDEITNEIIDKVTSFYNTPLVWKDSDIQGSKLWFKSQIDGMSDYKNDQEAFFRKLSELYIRAIQIWFHFIHYTYMPQVYKSLPRIKFEDPEYFNLLKILSNNSSNEEKISSAKEIYKKVWR